MADNKKLHSHIKEHLHDIKMLYQDFADGKVTKKEFEEGFEMSYLGINDILEVME